jgi:fatty-acyl-CoA synthase
MTIDAIRRNTLGDVLWRTARRVPHKTAIRCGEIEWTYAEFDALVTRGAAGLAASGVRSGDRIAVLSRNSHYFAVLRFALARLGAVLVPINFMLLADEVAHILRHSGASRLCVDTQFAELGASACERATDVQQIIWLPGELPTQQPAGSLSFEDILANENDKFESAVSAQSVAQIMYTSGTESLPKGVMLTHEAILTQYLSCAIDLEIDAGDRVLHSLPMYHCAQLDCWFGPCVLVGGFNLIICTPEPERILRLIEKYRINSFFAPPTVWISLLRSPVFDESDLTSLQKGYYGASIMPVEVLLELQRRLSNLRLWNAYGQTEIAPLATVLRPEDQIRKAGSAGKPVIHVETRVVREDMTDVEVGEVGEVVHRSPQLMLGYLNDPERTAAAFKGGWFHSGDLAVLDAEGYLTIVDRKKDMIKTGGENVASREVEESIYRLQGVSEVAVIGLSDPHWVEAVTAVIVVKNGAKLSEAEVMSHCAQTLGSYKRPKRVVFTDALPRNASGKVMKRELRIRYSQAADAISKV